MFHHIRQQSYATDARHATQLCIPPNPSQAANPASEAVLPPLSPSHASVESLRARAEGVLDRGLEAPAALAASFVELSELMGQVGNDTDWTARTWVPALELGIAPLCVGS